MPAAEDEGSIACATSSKARVVACVAIALTIFGSIASADLASDIATCQSIADKDGRLACFDRIQQKSTAEPATPATTAEPATTAKDNQPTAPTAAATREKAPEIPPRQPAVAEPQATFGAESLPPPPATPDRPKTLKARVEGNVRGIRKGQVMHLDNGQLWRSVDDHDYDYDADKPEITIERNFIGTYWMGFPDSGFRVRVRRIK